jgi:membrane dipeptidase
MFRAICQTGGVAGFNMCAPFVGEKPDLDTVADHFIHFLELGGEKNLALGGDLDGCDVLPAGFTGVQDYPKLAEKLLQRGFGEALVYDIFWNNAMGVMSKCCT